MKRWFHQQRYYFSPSGAKHFLGSRLKIDTGRRHPGVIKNIHIRVDELSKRVEARGHFLEKRVPVHLVWNNDRLPIAANVLDKNAVSLGGARPPFFRSHRPRPMAV